MAGDQLPIAGRAVHIHQRAFRMRREADAFGVQAHGDPLGLQDGLDGGGDVRILPPDQARGLFHHRHPGAEAAIHLGEFQADIAAADHHQVTGQNVQLQHADIGQERDLVHPRHVGDKGAPADVQEDPFGGQQLVVDAQGLGVFEAGVSPQHRGALHALEPGLDPGPGLQGDSVGPGGDPRHVDADRALDGHPVVRRPAREVGGIGAGHQGLGRHAAGVDAGAAEQLALHQGDAHARGGQPPGQRRTRLAGADDDGVEPLGHRATRGTAR